MADKIRITTGAVIDSPGSSVITKTGSWRTMRPEWNQKRCTQCMTCWQFCPDNAIPEKDKKRTETNFDYCKGCGICAQVCPVTAIIMKKEEK